MTDQAKPCPFCGGTNIAPLEVSHRWWVAECADCGAQCGEVRRQTMGEGTPVEWEAKARSDAIAEWGRRAETSDTPDKPTLAECMEAAEKHRCSNYDHIPSLVTLRALFTKLGAK